MIFLEYPDIKEIKEKCPRCGSFDIEKEDYMGAICVVCNSCGFDERETYEVFTEEKTNQKHKKEYSPYKLGGKNRINKLK